MKRKNITVYCSASNNISAEYLRCGEEVAVALVKNGFSIVYGGGQQGIMGRLAKTALAQKGTVIGVIPNQLIETEKAYTDIAELVFTQDMRERKRLMEDYGDAFLVLPGGIGTFDEMFETLTQKTIGIFDKPLIILNIFDFYTPLIEYLNILNEKGFLHKNSLDHLVVFSSIEEVIWYLNQYFAS